MDAGRARAGREPGAVRYAVTLCALVLAFSAVGPWGLDQVRRGDSWVARVYVGDGAGDGYADVGPLGSFGLDRLLVPLAGLTALLGAANPFAHSPEGRRGSPGAPLAGFAAAGLLLVAFSDAAEASLGLGGWSSRVLGGVRAVPGEPAAREAWGWGAGLAFWSIVAGLALSLVALWRERAAGRVAGRP